MIKVYIWTTEFPGHASMAWWDADDKAQAGMKAYFSWWPKKASNLFQQAFGRNEKRMPVHYLGDKMKEGGDKVLSANYKFEFRQLNEQAVLGYWQGLIESEGDEGKYHYLNHNCCTTVASALNAGGPGVEFPRHKVWTPKDILAYCTSIQRQSLLAPGPVVTGISQDKSADDLTVAQMPKARYHQGMYKPKYHGDWDWEPINVAAGIVQ